MGLNFLLAEDGTAVLSAHVRIMGEPPETEELLEEFRRAYNDYLNLLKFPPTRRDQLVAGHTMLGGDDEDREIHF